MFASNSRIEWTKISLPIIAALSKLGTLFAEEDDTVRVQRRRPAGPSSPSHERAQAPSRQRPGGGSPPPGGGMGGMRPTGGPALPGGGMGLIGIIIVVILGVVFGLPNIFSGGDTTSTVDQQEAANSA